METRKICEIGFSAKTNCNAVQDLIDKKLDKKGRCKVTGFSQFGPSGN